MSEWNTSENCSRYCAGSPGLALTSRGCRWKMKLKETLSRFEGVAFEITKPRVFHHWLGNLDAKQATSSNHRNKWLDVSLLSSSERSIRSFRVAKPRRSRFLCFRLTEGRHKPKKQNYQFSRYIHRVTRSMPSKTELVVDWFESTLVFKRAYCTPNGSRARSFSLLVSFFTFRYFPFFSTFFLFLFFLTQPPRW